LNSISIGIMRRLLLVSLWLVVIALVEANKPTTPTTPSKSKASLEIARDDIVDNPETLPSKRKDSSDTSFLSKLFADPSSSKDKKEEESIKEEAKSEKKESLPDEQDVKLKSGRFSEGPKEEGPETASRDSTRKKKESSVVETKPETRPRFQGTKKAKQVPKKVESPKREKIPLKKSPPKKIPEPSKEASQKEDSGIFGLPKLFLSGKDDDKKEAPVKPSKPSWRDQRKPVTNSSRSFPFGLFSSDKKKVATLDKGKKAKEIAKVEDDKPKQQNAEDDTMFAAARKRREELKKQGEDRALKRAQAQKEKKEQQELAAKKKREERELQQQQRKEAAASKRKGKSKEVPEKDASDKNEEENEPENKEEVSSEVETSEGDGAVNTTAPVTSGNEAALQESTAATPPQKQQPSGMIVMGGPPGMGGSPPYIIRRQAMSPQRGGMPVNAPPPSNSGAVIAEVTASLVATAMRLSFLTWLTRRLAAEEESMSPTQHFVWECMNDRYTRDEKALGNALSRPPIGISARAWKQYTKKLLPKNKSKVTLPNRTVVVVDITPNESLDLGYMSDVVTFLVSQHTKKNLGENLEVVLLVHSPGGAVTSYGLAASQIARLRDVGIETTVCVDKVAASGGYMMASQATRILAAPFAAVGSIGVMMETLNFNKILNTYGVQPLHLKAGEHKNLISTFGEVTDMGVKEEQKRLDHMHRAFIDLCISNRPDLNETVCDGSVLFGAEAQKVGMIDRIQTSDEYIWEKLRDGDHVLMLHKSNGVRGRRKLLALDLLPHLKRIPKEKIRVYLTEAFKLTTVVGMILRTLKR
jgi:ATP-dependent protease ClpP protease subunit